MRYGRDGGDGWRYVLLVASVVVLAACGGDGSDEDAGGAVPSVPDATDPHPPMPSFDVGGGALWMLMGEHQLRMGKVERIEQQPDGSVRTLGRFVADTGVKVTDVQGNADFAMGTWRRGSYRDDDSADSAQPIQFGVQYVVYRPLSALPPAGEHKCVPHLSPATGPSGKTPINVEGDASVVIAAGEGKAHVNLRITSAAGSVPLTRDVSFTGESTGLDAGALISGQTGMGVGLGDGHDAGLLVVAPWRVRSSAELDIGGVAVFDCR